jgi:eukaryotic-like serine/threonine-protein kinase
MSRIASQVRLAKIGDYRILKVLGTGSGGTVYLGQGLSTGKPVAIKVISGKVLADPVLRLRFAKECRVARKLDHPHIVQVLDFGLDGNTPYLVMEYLDGGSLGQRLDREGRLPEAKAVALISQIGQALQWAHERRLVHRDVKPDNILLHSKDQAKLSDLGLVKNLDDDVQLTKSLDYLGTPNFMAPEQFNDASNADALCDLYSLGATLYMTVTGELPYRGRNAFAVATVLKKKLGDDLVPPIELVPELSERVNDAILRALKADREQRHASVQEFLEALTEKGAITARAPSRESRKQAPGRDKRVKRRHTSWRSTTCERLQGAYERSWSGRVVDISETGLCWELDRRFEQGVMLAIALEGELVIRHSLVACVMWVQQLGPQSWKMGCQFAQPLTEREMHGLR